MHRGSMTLLKILLSAILMFTISMFSSSASAEVRNVPADHPTIQSCIDAANDGDECVVAPGTYNEAINFLGKAITLRSSEGRDVTIIDGTNILPHITVGITSFEQLDTIISGFTIMGGIGIFVIESSPTITDCNFVNIGSRAMDIAIDSKPHISNCIFNNTTTENGTLIVESSSPLIQNCVFKNNVNVRRHGTIYVLSVNSYGDSRPTIINCTFYGNSNTTGVGAAVYSETQSNVTSSPIIKNCVFWNNGTDQIFNGVDAYTSIEYSNIEGGWPGKGNIDVDPMIVRNPSDGGDGWGDNPQTPDIDEGANDDFGDLRLKPGSPCIDAGDNEAVPGDISTDFDGLPRFVNDFAIEPDPGFGTPPVVDMGAYEYQADCNNNQIPDDIDITTGQSNDCNENGYPDQCEESIDSDTDGLIDECDTCLESQMDETLIINGCETNVANIMFEDGCTMADVIAECQSEIRRHDQGKNASCVVTVANNWLRNRLITGREYSQIVRCSARTVNHGRNTLTNIKPQQP